LKRIFGGEVITVPITSLNDLYAKEDIKNTINNPEFEHQFRIEPGNGMVSIDQIKEEGFFDKLKQTEPRITYQAKLKASTPQEAERKLQQLKDQENPGFFGKIRNNVNSTLNTLGLKPNKTTN
jgi:hypothetical protein